MLGIIFCTKDAGKIQFFGTLEPSRRDSLQPYVVHGRGMDGHCDSNTLDFELNEFLGKNTGTSRRSPRKGSIMLKLFSGSCIVLKTLQIGYM